MVIIPSSWIVRRIHIILRLIVPYGRRVRREGITAVSLGHDRLRRSDCRDDGPVRVHEPYIRPVLVAHPEHPVVVDHQALGVHGDVRRGGVARRQVVAEAIARPRCGGEQGEVVVGQAARPGGVEPGCWLAVWSFEEDRVQVREVEVGRCWVLDCGVGLELERDVELVDSVDEVCS